MKRPIIGLFLIGLAVLLAGCAARSAGRAQDPGIGRASNQGRTPTGGEPFHGLIQYRAKDAKEAIVDPVLLNSSDAVVAAGTKVIGVFINGEARAYPLFILNNHQVVNDEVGDTPLSASW